jgi:hypothetical protein
MQKRQKACDRFYSSFSPLRSHLIIIQVRNHVLLLSIKIINELASFVNANMLVWSRQSEEIETPASGLAAAAFILSTSLG